ncbi:MAG: tryptophan synthase subunit alpha [Clostridiales Family XIII bacterium]|jgi:tryptophan synthase alpha chain|nr:tryptophan synthase subunit alpha [Clostridiales Family XIII bacterium]
MSEDRIAAAFKGGKAFIAYLMAGDPTMEKTREYILAMVEAGADVIELGVPFSDPIAEGETIQAANLRAFASGTDVGKAFALAASLKGEMEAPLLFMTYVNLLHNYGYEAFFAKCAECGVSGVVLPDLPFEEQGELSAFAEASGVCLITLVAPTSGERAERMARDAKGFIYLVSSMGVTGVRSEIGAEVPALAAGMRARSKTPVAVGFGIHSPEQAAEMAAHADGVIVGSAIVDIIAKLGGEAKPALTEYVRAMKAAVMGVGGEPAEAGSLAWLME